MNTTVKFLLVTCLLLLSQIPGLSHADGLSDLKNALYQLQGSKSISAELESTSVDTKGEDKKKIFTHGQVRVFLEDGVDGLQVLYSSEVLKKMEAEARLKAKDEDADTRTLNAIDGINASELHSMLSAAASLLRDINQAEYLSETETLLNGRNARLLRFKLPMEFFISDKKVRSYVNKFKAEYLIWINKTGTPIESRIEFSGRGRVFIFFKISVTGSAFSRYQTVGERLLVVHREGAYLNDTSLGVFEHSEIKTLQIIQQQ